MIYAVLGAVQRRALRSRWPPAANIVSMDARATVLDRVGDTHALVEGVGSQPDP